MGTVSHEFAVRSITRIFRKWRRYHGNERSRSPVPEIEGIDTSGLNLNDLAMQRLLEVDSDSWSEEVPLIEEHLKAIGDRLPKEMTSQLDNLKARIGLGS